MKWDFDHLNQIKNVSSFPELVDTKFSGKNNALCWQRLLDGDFEEIVDLLELKENITDLTSQPNTAFDEGIKPVTKTDNSNLFDDRISFTLLMSFAIVVALTFNSSSKLLCLMF